MAASFSSQNQYLEPQFYYCHCGEKMNVRTSWTKLNPARRFVKCPDVKTRFCTRYRFLDDELPSDYYKEILYELRLQNKRKTMTNEMEDDATSNIVLMKKMEELTILRSKLKIFNKVFALLIVVLLMLCVVIVVLVMK